MNKWKQQFADGIDRIPTENLNSLLVGVAHHAGCVDREHRIAKSVGRRAEWHIVGDRLEPVAAGRRLFLNRLSGRFRSHAEHRMQRLVRIMTGWVARGGNGQERLEVVAEYGGLVGG